MKKSLLALAVLGTVGLAHAQTAVVIDGSIDTAIQYRQQAVGSNTLGLAASQRNTNYIGISGTEDIGGGLKGIFQIRTNFGSDAARNDGTASTVLGDQNVWLGLQGGFGTVKLGRDLTPQFLQVSAYSTFGTGFLNNRALMNSGSVDARWNNSVQYVTPSLAGFGLQVMVAPRNENAATLGTAGGTNFTVNSGLTPAQLAALGMPVSARATYGAGPLSAGLAVTRNGSAGPDAVWNLGGSYNFGIATIKAQYERDQNTRGAGAASVGGVGTALGATDVGNAWLVAAEGGVPGTAVVLRAQYSKRNTATLQSPFEKAYGLGADYNLSKRTVAYLYWGSYDIGAATTTATATAAGTATGRYRDTVLGIRHAF
jgi:predicted porin